jgi:hypothetical protein
MTVAQAFHWFRTETALDEVVRVVRPGGWLALLWNEPPESGWAAELWELRHRLTGFDGGYPGRGWEAVLDGDGRFGTREVTRVTHAVTTTLDELAADSASRSYVHVLDGPDRERVLDTLSRFLADHPDTAGRDVVTYERPSALHLCRRLP